MSDTPETDALREAIDNGAATEAEMTSLAGKLERERDAVLAEVAEYEAVRHRQAVELLRVKNESVARQENHSLNVQLTVALKERDEAREALLKLSAFVRRLFELLETVEVSDSEREFHPTVIRSCRVAHTSELAELLPQMKEAAK